MDAIASAIVSEAGVPIGEEYTSVLATAYCSRRARRVVANLSTTSALESSRNALAVLFFDEDREVNVTETMTKENAVMRREGMVA